MLRIFPVLFLFCIYTKSFAQKDSSAIFESRISGGSSKTWHSGLPVIIDVPRNIPQKSFTFHLKPKTAEFVSIGGRQINSRKFTAWSIKKQPDSTYLLMFPKGENYFISFRLAENNSRILILTDAPDLPTTSSVRGSYFERKPQINQ